MSIPIPQAGLELIQHFESFSPTIYICPAGLPTIGYGHVVLKGEEELFKDGISEDQATSVLEKDCQQAARAIMRLTKVKLTEYQFAALLSFVFNLGAGAYQRSTLRLKINREEHDEVPNELMKWTRGGGRILKGLVKRRKAEAKLYEKGILIIGE